MTYLVICEEVCPRCDGVGYEEGLISHTDLKMRHICPVCFGTKKIRTEVPLSQVLDLQVQLDEIFSRLEKLERAKERREGDHR